jgi:hypothetical protein
LIVEGNLNLNFWILEVWGEKPSTYFLSGYFLWKLDDLWLYAIETINIQPTWENMHVGVGRGPKTLD